MVERGPRPFHDVLHEVVMDGVVLNVVKGVGSLPYIVDAFVVVTLLPLNCQCTSSSDAGVAAACMVNSSDIT